MSHRTRPREWGRCYSYAVLRFQHSNQFIGISGVVNQSSSYGEEQNSGILDYWISKSISKRCYSNQSIVSRPAFGVHHSLLTIQTIYLVLHVIVVQLDPSQSQVNCTQVNSLLVVRYLVFVMQALQLVIYLLFGNFQSLKG